MKSQTGLVWCSAIRELIFPLFRIVYRREATRARSVRVWRSERLRVLSD